MSKRTTSAVADDSVENARADDTSNVASASSPASATAVSPPSGLASNLTPEERKQLETLVFCVKSLSREIVWETACYGMES